MLLSEVALEVHEPTGADEMRLLETPLPPIAAVAELASRVIAHPGGAGVDWAALPASQLGAVALTMRRAWIGERVVSEGTCPGADCGERFDVSFAVSTYLTHRRSRRPRNVLPVVEDGWYALTGTAIRFRIPSVTDLLSAVMQEQPELALLSTCVDPPDVPGKDARRVHLALSALSPTLDGLVGGVCPSCGSAVTLSFDPLTYTLAELRDTFAGIYRETHALASTYGWSEDTIVCLPRGRRQRYCSMIIGEPSLR